MKPRTPLVVVLALALALPLAACGRKGPPEPPDNADPRYPRSYPAGAPTPAQNPQ
jgi:predicted small lipoprotein YifL